LANITLSLEGGEYCGSTAGGEGSLAGVSTLFDFFVFILSGDMVLCVSVARDNEDEGTACTALGALTEW
jgi:hypothetical protein